MNKNLKKDKKKKGFTLIELIIVIAILTILAAIAIPNLTSVRDNAKVKADKASCDTIKRATLALIAGDQIKPSSSGNMTAVFDKGKSFVAFTGGWTGTTADTAVTESDIGYFLSSIKEVNPPQVSTNKTYTVVISSVGDVDVTTTTTAAPTATTLNGK